MGVLVCSVFFILFQAIKCLSIVVGPKFVENFTVEDHENDQAKKEAGIGH